MAEQNTQTRRASRTFKHATRVGYTNGCRCELCRGAWAAYIRKRRHARGGVTRERRLLEQDIERVERGSQSDDKAVAMQVRLTPLALRILAAAQRAKGLRRDDVVDRLLRQHGPRLTA